MNQDTPSQGGGSQPPPASASPATLQSNERTMAMLAHLLAIFTWFLGPLIIWLTQKESSAFVDDQGKEALNFQITIGIVYVAVGIATCLTLGLGAILMPLVGIVNLIFCILACVAANKGERYRYPIAIRLIK
jgi:uncharacterized Tic20 family protein